MKVTFIEDTKISAKEKGLMLIIDNILLEDKKPTIANIKEKCSDGELSICSGLKKLEELGYFVRSRTSSLGYFQYSYEFNEAREVQE